MVAAKRPWHGRAADYVRSGPRREHVEAQVDERCRDHGIREGIAAVAATILPDSTTYGPRWVRPLRAGANVPHKNRFQKRIPSTVASVSGRSTGQQRGCGFQFEGCCTTGG